MANLDIGQIGRTALDGSITTYEVDSKSLDSPSEEQDTVWTFTDAARNIGYYKTIPELKRAIDTLAIWSVGKGFEVEAKKNQIILENMTGWGEDSFQSIMENMMVMKKVIGDSFAEIIRNDKGTLINLKPLSPEKMRVIVNQKGMIKRYEQVTPKGFTKFQPHEILHLCNDRIGDEIHGTAIIDSCKWVIDALHEVLTDHRKTLHRNVVPVRIIEIDTEDTSKRDRLISYYEEAIKKGEVLVIPKGTVEFKDNEINIQDPMAWITYLENYFFIAAGVPRILVTSEGFTEAGGKVGFLTFEPVYTREQTLLEQDLWSQLAIRVTFNRPPSLGGLMREDEAKNTGQTGFQPKEAGINLERE